MKMRYAYLTATSYSGSTLLSLLMNTHPKVASIGELANSVALSRSKNAYFCSCGTEINNCEFWIAVCDKCAESGMTLDLYNFGLDLDLGCGKIANKLVFGVAEKFIGTRALLDLFLRHLPIHKRMIRQVRERTTVIARSVLDVTGKSVFFDISKDIRRATYLVAEETLQLKLIHLVRDPRAVLYSFLRHNSSAPIDKIIKYWIRTHTNVLALKSKICPEDYLLVRYEDLCQDPELALRYISKFLSVDDYPSITDVNSYSHHIIGNQMRKRPFSGIKEDNEWCANLPISISSRCAKRTESLAVMLGYAF